MQSVGKIFVVDSFIIRIQRRFCEQIDHFQRIFCRRFTDRLYIFRKRARLPFFTPVASPVRIVYTMRRGKDNDFIFAVYIYQSFIQTAERAVKRPNCIVAESAERRIF